MPEHLTAAARARHTETRARRRVAVSKVSTHQFRHTAATNLINAGVPLHVVMRYFGHVSPDMTLHYAVTSAQTMEEEFLRYKKVTRDGRTATIDSSDLYDLIQLDKRAIPNSHLAQTVLVRTLPPKQSSSADKGNAHACLAPGAEIRHRSSDSCPAISCDGPSSPDTAKH